MADCGHGGWPAGCRGRQRGACAAAVARPRRYRRRLAGVAAVARPAVAGALAGAGLARSWRLAAAAGYTFESSLPRSPVSSPSAPAPSCWGIRWAASSAWPWPAAGSHAGAGGHRPGDQGRLDREELNRAQAAARRRRPGSPRATGCRTLLAGVGAGRPAARRRPGRDEGLREEHGRWRLAVDPGAFAVGAPDMTHLLARSQAPVMLARGEHDAMNTDEQLVAAGRPRGHAARPGAQRPCGEPAPDDQGPGPVPVTPGGQRRD